MGLLGPRRPGALARPSGQLVAGAGACGQGPRKFELSAYGRVFAASSPGPRDPGAVAEPALTADPPENVLDLSLPVSYL